MKSPKKDRVGQWVNVFSMAMGLTLGRDEADRLTQGPRGQLTPEHFSRLSPDSAGDPEERPLQPAHHPACSCEHQLFRRPPHVRRGKKRGSSADRMCSSPRTLDHSHPSHTICYQSFQAFSYVHFKLCPHKSCVLTFCVVP